MSLLTSCSDANKVTSSALSVAFETIEHRGACWEIVRRATKSYEYLGLTEAAAKLNADAKRSQFYRPYFHDPQYSQPSNVPTVANFLRYRSCADIAAQHVAGHAWKIAISLNEEDHAYVLAEPADPAAKLNSLKPGNNPITMRTYDETGDFALAAIRFSSTSGSAWTIAATLANIPLGCSLCAFVKTSAQTSAATVRQLDSGNAFSIDPPESSSPLFISIAAVPSGGDADDYTYQTNTLALPIP